MVLKLSSKTLNIIFQRSKGGTESGKVCNIISYRRTFRSFTVIEVFFLHIFFYCYVMLYSTMFHLYDGGQHYDGRKSGSALGKTTTISRLLPDLIPSTSNGAMENLVIH